MSTPQSEVAQPRQPRAHGPRRGGGGRNHRTQAQSAASTVSDPSKPLEDDTEAVRSLRAKYGEQLGLLRELFPDWTDEDLLFALQDAGGQVEETVGRISEGHAEQFSSVKSKKQVKRETAQTEAPGVSHGWKAANEAAARRTAAGADRGGKTRGVAAARGARGGGRGGLRGVSGRGGGIAPQANGHAVEAAPTAVAATTPATTAAPNTTASSSTAPSTGAGLSWADRASKKHVPAPAVPAPSLEPAEEDKQLAWSDDPSLPSLGNGTRSADVTTEAPSTTSVPHKSEPQSDPGIVHVKVPASQASAEAAAPVKRSWAQIATPKPPAPAIAPAPQAAPAAEVQAEEPKSEPAQQEQAPAAAIEEPQTVPETFIEQSIEPEPLEAPQEIPAEPETTAVESSLPAAPASVPAKPSTGRPTPTQPRAGRPKQGSAVVMPAVIGRGNSARPAPDSSALDRLGVTFGSFNLGEGEPTDETAAAAAAPTSAAQTQPEALPQTANAATSPPHAYNDGFAAQATSQSQLSQPAQQPAADAYQQQQTPGTTNGTESSYSHFGSDAFGQQSQAYSNFSQQQYSTPASSQTPESQTPYSNFYGSQQPQQQQSASQQQPQQQQQAPQQQQSSAQDYHAYDSSRLSSFYNNYDQTSGSPFGARGEENKAQQPTSQIEHQHSGQHGVAAGAPQQAAPAQQQYPGGMQPYYYQHPYWMPSHQMAPYGPGGAYYGQNFYGGPAPQHAPQHHPSKPGTPATSASPYPQSAHEATPTYGSQGYGSTQQQQASSGLSGSYGSQSFNERAPSNLGGASNDYAKYGGANALGNFFGASNSQQGQQAGQQQQGQQASSQQTQQSGAGQSQQLQKSGTPVQNQSSNQQPQGAGPMDSSYRQYDAGSAAKQQVPTGPSSASSRSGQLGAPPHLSYSGYQQQGQTQQQQQQQQHPQQQQQHPAAHHPQQPYYQQYGMSPAAHSPAAYSHQQSSGNTSYNYGYRGQQQGYWGGASQ